MLWPKKVCFHDGRSPRTYIYVFRDFICPNADIGECLKYFYYYQNLARMSSRLRRPSYHLTGLKIGTNDPTYVGAEKNLSPSPTSGHGTTARFPFPPCAVFSLNFMVSVYSP